MIHPSMPVSRARTTEYIERGYWDDRHLRDGIEAGASRSRDSPAVVDNRVELTWSELAARVGAGVTKLERGAVAPGDCVLLIAGNSALAVVAYHSILRRGATAVLLDRRCGPADIRAARQAIDISAMIVPHEMRARLGIDPGDATLWSLEDFWPADDSPPGAPWSEPARHGPAVVLFTSGTTSRPKAVIHSINTLTSGARNMAHITSADENTVIFLVSPVTSITGVMQMHLAADVHATLVLEDEFDPPSSLDRLIEHGATLLGGAPVIVERLLRAAAHRPMKQLPLRNLAVGGSMLPRPLLERAMDEYGIQISRVYGSSEAPNSTGSLPDDDRDLRLADDGALMPGTEIRVGSSAHPGEGLLRSPGAFLGYVDTEDNRAAFDGDWYRTGDLVEVSNGRLTVVGRLQEVVNRNGFKISLPEIDAALDGAPGIEEYCSFGVPDAVTGEHLAVAVLPVDGAAITLESVVTHLKSAGLATRKLPEQLVIWDQPLPRTTSGKVVRSRLVMEATAKRSLLAGRLRAGAETRTGK